MCSLWQMGCYISHLRALLLQRREFSLVKLSSERVDIRQVGIRVHQGTHCLPWLTTPQSLVDFGYCLQHCTQTHTRAHTHSQLLSNALI